MWNVEQKEEDVNPVVEQVTAIRQTGIHDIRVNTVNKP
jgi:hypothetical protein